ncbi:MAG: preprotein translocase subunit SecA [Paludibacteraceae bacterium]|nr:preprotein translocase subunit SecA [Paludibacteraceae bacterium]
MGLNDILSKWFGNKAQRDMREIKPYVEKVEMIYPTIGKLTNDELRARTLDIRERIQKYVSAEKSKIQELKSKIEGQEIEEREKTYSEIDRLEKLALDKYEEVLEEVLPEVFAIVKDTARRFSESEIIEVTASELDRELAATGHDFLTIEGDKALYRNHWMAGGNEVTWNMVHYNVQLFGGVVLHKGKIAEMATGEGKTLVATLPVFLNALTGNGVHVITVNDYLSKRDSEWMGPLYMFHGLTVDCIDKHRPNSPERRKAYLADITFGTNNEFGFDYLRDNMATSPEDLVQRSHNYAIVDEVDSVLIDDARTPLIIAGQVQHSNEQQYEQLCPRVEHLVSLQRTLATNFLTQAKTLMKSQDKQEQEDGALALFRSYKALPKNTPLIKFLSEPGIKAILLKTEEFYMAENNKNMHIATEPLYFVIDEKHKSIELTDKGIDALTGASEDPQFFVLPDMSARVAELDKADISKEEKQRQKEKMLQDYSIKTERIHTINQLLKAYTLFNLNEEYVVIEGKVKIVDEGTGRIMEGRRYSDGLHQAIEAKEHVKVEAATQTHATITLQNYFRMYHKLAGMTGTAETEAGEFWNIYKLDVVVVPTNRPIARKDMNDRVYRTKREKYKAVIEEIERLVNAGRPVLVGTTSVEISEMISKMLLMRKIPHNVLNAKLHQKEAEIVAEAGKSSTVTIATNMAGRGTDIKLSDEVKAAGGLAIIGTERHESRRVDRQLRGRAGRQGDPGSSVFFVSLEDSLMRLFGSEKITKVMDRMGFKEGEVIEHSMISKSIERAQKKVEENHFGVRKRLLEYDDVMNSQREVIYKKRRETLMGERLGVNIMNMIYDAIYLVAEEAKTGNDYDYFKDELMLLANIEPPVSQSEFLTTKLDVLAEKSFAAAMTSFKHNMDAIADQTAPEVARVIEEFGDQYINIIIPITDGVHTYRIPVNLKEANETKGKAVVKTFQKAILLHEIDEYWKDHLRDMDELKDSVQNASYEQKDPLLIYKKESFGLFRKMVEELNRTTVTVLLRSHIQEVPQQTEQEAPQAPEVPQEKKFRAPEYTETRSDSPVTPPAPAQDRPRVTAPIRSDKVVGRNDPCPCGSGKKYKNCHGANL